MLVFLWNVLFRLIAWRRPGYAERLEERRGEVPVWHKSDKKRYWIHASSLGEMRLALCLERMMSQIDPASEYVITAWTPAGSFLCRKESQAYHVYVPYNTHRAVTKFLDRVQPDALILVETELWPKMLSVLADRSVPVYVANARLGLRSLELFRWMPRALHAIHSVLAQSPEDAERFRSLGVRRVSCAENLKLCLTGPEVPKQRGIWTLCAASVQWGEAAMLDRAYRTLENTTGRLRLILAPRRLEDVERWAALWADRTVLRASAWNGEEVDVLIVDSFGVLDQYYALADVVFVGGSWVARGGQNVLEPARHGLAITTGPSDYNFKRIVAMMKEAGALLQYDAVDSWIAGLIDLRAHPERGEAMGSKALKFVHQMRVETEDAYRAWLETTVMGKAS